MEYLGKNIRECVTVEDPTELRRMLDEHIRQCIDTRQDAVRAPSRQQYEHESNLIPMCSRNRRDLPKFRNYIFPCTVTSQVKDTLTNGIQVIMTKKTPIKLNRE